MSNVVHKPIEEPERFNESEEIVLGAWAWVYDGEPDDDGDIEGWLGCVTHVGSNYLQITEPHTERQSHHKTRVHFDDVADVIDVEPDPESVIKQNIDERKTEVEQLIVKVRDLLESLGLRDRALPSPAAEQSTALVLASSVPDVKEHKHALVTAKEKTLPDIFEQIEEANSDLVRWMSAKALPMVAQADRARAVVSQIEDRVFTIELYAGLLEDVKLVRRGKPAQLGEKLKIMQRRCYMDEECLLGYRSGGIDIHDLTGFDKWLSEKENFERVLPFPRCMVAFRVRRRVKEREWDGTFGGAFLNVRLTQSDKLTFLYIRNGRRLYRLNTELEFGPKIFPDKDEHVLQDKMWAKMFADKVDEIVPDREYQADREEIERRERERKKKDKRWRKKNPGKGHIYNPHSSWSDPIHDWDRSHQPYSPESVYYDDIHDHIGRRIKAYNRIAVIVQGLFDRSKVLHPHAPVQLWSREGFDAAVEMIYDSDRTLYPSAEAPDFEEYHARLNESMGERSVTVGQEEYWERKEAVKYMNSRYAPTNYIVRRHTPYGNPGPGFLSRIARWMPNAHKAVFRWQRERQTYRRYYERDRGPILCRVAVPATSLLNVEAYSPGDFRQFYEDPRTRAGYLQWAEMLLSAEEFHAGNLKISDNGKDQ